MKPLCLSFLKTEKFHRNFKQSPYYRAPKDGGPVFTIVHYAGPVRHSHLPSLFSTPFLSMWLIPCTTIDFVSFLTYEDGGQGWEKKGIGGRMEGRIERGKDRRE